MRRIALIAAVTALVLASLGPLDGTAQAAFPGGDGDIAYGTLFPLSRVYTIGSDGSNRTMVTPADWAASSPAWSADGSTIAFVRNRPDGSSSALMTMDPNGSGLSTVVPFATGRTIDSPTWSPDGNSLAFCAFRRHGPAIFTVHANGTALTNITLGTHDDCDPAWSPDGNTIALDTHLPATRASRIVTINPDGTGRTVVVNLGFNYYPDWSPDGTHLTFARFVPDPGAGFGTYDIFTVKTDGTQLRNLTRSPSRSEWTPAYSPSGTSIVYAREQGATTSLPDDLWIIASNGVGRPTRLTDTPRYDEFNPSWQPT